MAHRADQSTHKIRGVDKPLGKKRRMKKQAAPPANTEIIAPGAELPAPRQKKPHELEAEKPEDYADHEVTVPMLDFDGSEGKGTVRGRIQKKISIEREAEIVERLREVAILAEPEDAARLLPRALDLVDKLKTSYALAEARAYISMLAHKRDAAESEEKLEKRRVYLKPGQHAPPGHAEREGKLGGRYYEVGGREQRHEPTARIERVGEASPAVFELVETGVSIAEELGWEPQIKRTKVFTDLDWEYYYRRRESRVSTGAAYAHYVFDDRHLGIGPKCARDIASVLGGSGTWGYKYGVQALAHEIIHSDNPISGWAYRGANAQIEEAITEWLCPELGSKILQKSLHVGEDAAQMYPSAYIDEVQSLERVAGQVAGVNWPYKRERIYDTIRRWKKAPPNTRAEMIREELVAAIIHEDYPDIDSDIIVMVAGMNSSHLNWSDFWQGKGLRHRERLLEKLGMDAFKAARSLLAEQEPKDVSKRGARSRMTSEEIKAKARARVKAWRERLKAEGRKEKRVGKDFGAAPPADAMVGTDVHDDAIGSGARRKKKPEGIFEEKQLATGSVSSEDMGSRSVLQVPDSACSKGTCEIFASTYGSEILTEAVPQDINPAYGNVGVLYKADEEEDGQEVVVGGYASPQVIDREKHLISRKAMAADLPRFLAHPKYRNVMLLHSNVQVGEVLPEWADPKTGKVYRTEVDDIGLFCVIKVRTDEARPPIVDEVLKDIESGKLAAFSISGDAPLESREYTCKDGTCFWYISEIIFYEITLCEEGVNQDAKLIVLSKALDTKHTCPMCAKVTKADTTLIDIAEGKIHASYTEAMDKLRELGHLDREERIALSSAITAALKAFGEEVERLGLDTRKVPAEDAALLVKALLATGYIKKNERVRLTERMMEGIARLNDSELGLLVNDAFPHESEGDGSESSQALREKVEAVAEGAGEEDAIQMLEDVQDAEDKAGSPGWAGPTTTGSMQDFGSSVIERTHARDKCMKCDLPPTVEVLWAEGAARAWFCDDHWAEWVKENPYEDVYWDVNGEVSKGVPVASPWMDDLILDEVDRYKKFVDAGAEPDEAYDKVIEESGSDKPWFGTRQDEFGYWLLHIAHDGYPIPDVRLRVDPRECGQDREPDPHWTAPALLDVWQEALAGWQEEQKANVSGKVGGALPYEGIVAPHKPHEEGDVVAEIQGRGAVMRSLRKGRVYLREGEEAPEGVKVTEGPRGGRYYEDTGRKGDDPERARERAKAYHARRKAEHQQNTKKLGKLVPGEWVHMTDAASAEAIERDGVQIQRGGRGGFYVSRVGSINWGDVPVRIRVRGKLIAQDSKEWGKLARVAHKRGGQEKHYNDVAREMGYDAIHLLGHGKSNWLVIVNPEAAIIQRDKVEQPPEKALVSDPWESYPNAPKPPEVTEERRNKLFEAVKGMGRLNDDGTVSLWHSTMVDRAENIMKEGFIPAKESAAGQEWEATHSAYATYFHGDPFAAFRDTMQSNEFAEGGEIYSTVIEARIPLDAAVLQRILPDEDVSMNPNDGMDAFEEGSAVALVGGWPADWLRQVPNDEVEQRHAAQDEWSARLENVLEPRDQLEDIDQQNHPKDVQVKVGRPSYVAQAEGTATPSKPITGIETTGEPGKPISPGASEDPVQERAEGTGGLGVPQPGGRVKKGRYYLKHGEEAPAGATVHVGPKGGRYIETPEPVPAEPTKKWDARELADKLAYNPAGHWLKDVLQTFSDANLDALLQTLQEYLDRMTPEAKAGELGHDIHKICENLQVALEEVQDEVNDREEVAGLTGRMDRQQKVLTNSDGIDVSDVTDRSHLKSTIVSKIGIAMASKVGIEHEQEGITKLAGMVVAYLDARAFVDVTEVRRVEMAPGIPDEWDIVNAGGNKERVSSAQLVVLGEERWGWNDDHAIRFGDYAPFWAAARALQVHDAGVAAGETSHAKVAHMLVKAWAHSSSDNNTISVALQRVVAKKFGVQDQMKEYVHPAVAARADHLIKDHTLVLDAWAEAVYDDTQKFLKDNEMEEVVVARGMRWATSDPDTIGEGAKVDPPDWVKNMPAGVVSKVTATMNPISSFSSDYWTARGFTSGTEKVMLVGKVSRERVFSTFRTGPGCADEYEIIVTGGDTELLGFRAGIEVGAGAGRTKGIPGNVQTFAREMRSSKLELAEGVTAFLDADMENADWAKRTNDVFISSEERVEKARHYIGEGEEAPEGVEVQEGPRGGRYYEAEGRKGADRVFGGKPVGLKNKPSKLETGEIGEEIVIKFLREQEGFDNAQRLSVEEAQNYPIDVMADHHAVEVKTGLVSNNKSAQHWRATIGQPGPKEIAWLKTLAPKEKAAWNRAKAKAAIKRKYDVLEEISQARGIDLKAKTYGVIVNTDTHQADIYVIDGFHERVGWKSELAKHAYLGTVSF